MALFDQNTWYILKHLHQSIATQAAAYIEAGEHLQPMAYLISPAGHMDRHTRMHVAEIAKEFIDTLMRHPMGEQLLSQYLSDALREGSAIQLQIHQEHGIKARYTLSVQETLLPAADSQNVTQPSPALMVLLRGKHFSLPIFHLICTNHLQQRICQLRTFPDMAEIEAAQHLLQPYPHTAPTVH